MSSYNLISQAHAAIAGAVRDKQYRAIPAIMAGYISAALGDSLTVSTLAKVSHHKLSPGCYFTSSPTKIEHAPEDVQSIRVPEIGIHVRPVLNIKKDIEFETIESIIKAIPVTLDRTYNTLIKTCAPWKFANELDLNHFWSYAIVGREVPYDSISGNAGVIYQDHSSLECRILNDREFILIDPSKGLPGTVMVSAVQQEALRSSGLAYRLNDGLLELGFSVKASIVILRPEAFLVAHTNKV